MRNRQITVRLIFAQNLRSEDFFVTEIFRISDLVKMHPLRPSWLRSIFGLKRKKSRPDGKGAHNIENFWKSYSGIFWELIITKKITTDVMGVTFVAT